MSTSKSENNHVSKEILIQKKFVKNYCEYIFVSVENLHHAHSYTKKM